VGAAQPSPAVGAALPSLAAAAGRRAPVAVVGRCGWAAALFCREAAVRPGPVEAAGLACPVGVGHLLVKR